MEVHIQSKTSLCAVHTEPNLHPAITDFRGSCTVGSTRQGVRNLESKYHLQEGFRVNIDLDGLLDYI